MGVTGGFESHVSYFQMARSNTPIHPCSPASHGLAGQAGVRIPNFVFTTDVRTVYEIPVPRYGTGTGAVVVFCSILRSYLHIDRPS